MSKKSDFSFYKAGVPGKVTEHCVLHVLEIVLGRRWPFSRTGWAIGVLLRQTDIEPC